MGFLKKIACLCFFIVAYLFLSYGAHQAWYFVTTLVISLNILFFLFNMRLGVMIFIPLMLLSEWSSRLDIRSASGITSMHSIYLGPFNIFTYMLILFAVIIFLRKGVSLVKLNLISIEKRTLFVFGAFFLIALSGVGNLVSFPRQYIADLAPLLNMICGFILARFLFVRRQDLISLIWVLIYCFTARAIVGVVWFLIGSGYSRGVVLLPFYDPVGAFPVFLCSVSLAILIFGNKLLSEKLFLFVVMLSGMAFFFMWPSRAQLIVMFLGVLFVAIFIPNRDRIRYGFFLVTVGSGLFVILNIIVPQIIGYAIWKISTFSYLRSGLIGPATMSQRLVEGYNILFKLWEEKNLLWGAGAGGWFDDSFFVFPMAWAGDIGRTSAFSEAQLFSWKFFKPHDTFLWVFLKGGLLGLFCYVSFLVFFLRDIITGILNSKHLWARIVLVGFTVPFVSQFLGFSSKSFVMAGILFAIIVNALRGANSCKESCLDRQTG